MSAVDIAASTAKQIVSRPLARAGYRPDIDGLRGVAVLSVVAMHAGLPGLNGGFLGVDVFFVISGFLIARSLEDHRWSGARGLLDFYGRRMRRTLPAMYAVALVTLIAGLVLLLPGELDDLVRSLLGVLSLAPNILFLNRTGYFDHAASAKPLLHSWSLGVEEQFYLLAPVLQAGLHRLGRRGRVLVLPGLFVLGLTFCVLLRAAAPAAAFYLMPARLWEFLAGTLIAARVIPPLRKRWLVEAVGAISLLALAAAMTLFSPDTAQPGLSTLVPCLATAALIHVGGARSTLASRLLGGRALAGIGVISYSVYLWHWPLLVFARLGGRVPSLAELAAGGALLLGVSALSWRYVELPFRRTGSFPRRHAAAILLPAAVCLGAASFSVILARGLPGRFSPEVARIASFYDYGDRRQFREGRCFITSKQGDAASFDRQVCLRTVADRPNLLLMGDSHGAHLWIGLKQAFPDFNVMQATASGCKPLLHASGKRYCTDLIRDVMEAFPPGHPVDTVVLSAAWNTEDAERLPETLAYLRRFARRVVVIGRIPGHTEPLPALLARGLLDGKPATVIEHQDPYAFAVDLALRRVVPAAEYVSLTDDLCPDARCRTYAPDGTPLQFDTDHLTSEGAVLVASDIRTRLSASHDFPPSNVRQEAGKP